MNKFIIYIVVLSSVFGFSQKKLSKLLNEFNNESIPYITVGELATQKSETILLDSRELEEYKIIGICLNESLSFLVNYNNSSMEI